MKTIELSDEMHEFLMNLSKELNTQDHRGTRMPYIFQIQEKKEMPAHEGSGDEVLYNNEDECEVRRLDEKIEWLCEWAHDNAFGLHSHEEIRKQYESLSEYDIDSLLEDKGFSKYNVQEIDVYSNAFLTSKACDEHIQCNKHNLNNPVNYLSGAFRNPELEKVMQFLCELSGGKLHT
jgi:hypothetical protein